MSPIENARGHSRPQIGLMLLKLEKGPTDNLEEPSDPGGSDQHKLNKGRLIVRFG